MHFSTVPSLGSSGTPQAADPSIDQQQPAEDDNHPEDLYRQHSFTQQCYAEHDGRQRCDKRRGGEVRRAYSGEHAIHDLEGEGC